MDDFDLDLRIQALERSYAAASENLRRGQSALRLLRAQAGVTPAQLAMAEKRCKDLTKKCTNIRAQLDAAEEEEASSFRNPAPHTAAVTGDADRG